MRPLVDLEHISDALEGRRLVEMAWASMLGFCLTVHAQVVQ